MGQSIGAEAILYLLAKNPNILTGSLVIDPINTNKILITSTHTPLIHFVSQEDFNSLKTQREKKYFNSSNFAFNSILNINPRENISKLEQIININLYIKEY